MKRSLFTTCTRWPAVESRERAATVASGRGHAAARPFRHKPEDRPAGPAALLHDSAAPIAPIWPAVGGGCGPPRPIWPPRRRRRRHADSALPIGGGPMPIWRSHRRLGRRAERHRLPKCESSYSPGIGGGAVHAARHRGTPVWLARDGRRTAHPRHRRRTTLHLTDAARDRPGGRRTTPRHRRRASRSGEDGRSAVTRTFRLIWNPPAGMGGGP